MEIGMGVGGCCEVQKDGYPRDRLGLEDESGLEDEGVLRV